MLLGKIKIGGVVFVGGKTPFKRMSEANFAHKKTKGLCFHCDGKFAPGYKCPKKSLQVMVINDGETKEEEEEQETTMDGKI
nr:ribosomal biogenesis regulatory protein [Tanacetum cinerariifolium]